MEMRPVAQSMVAAAYVRDIAISRAFYELLGFREHSAGQAEISAWSSMQQGGCRVVLTSTQPPLDVPALPLLFYFYYDDIDAAVRALDSGGVATTHMGYPPHARGGEVKVTDPDGNTVLLGQLDRGATQQVTSGSSSSRFSLLREAAAAVLTAGGVRAACQVLDQDQQPCPASAEVKLADPGGGSLWACMGHADEILLTVPAAFIASEGGPGLSSYRSRRPLSTPPSAGGFRPETARR
jgi:catechol 2,3-dioxygenase-like lactoylglutathione lyase family enzyme